MALSREFFTYFFICAFRTLFTKEYPFSITTSFFASDVDLKLAWQTDWDKQIVYFQVNVESSNRGILPNDVLIGFSDHGEIVGSDFCMYRKSATGKEKMYDGWIDQKGLLHADLHSDCKLYKTKNTMGKNIFYFSRKFLTCDPRDYAFEIGTTNVLLAIGFNPIVYLNDSSEMSGVFHTFRFTQVLQRLDHEATSPKRGRKYSELEIRTQNVEIPPEVTTYWCVGIELSPELQKKKHHAVRYEAIITKGMENVVHHFEVFHCQKPIKPFNSSCVDDHAKPVDARTCSKVIAAWAMGAGPVVYPEEAGMPLGGKDFIPYLMVEIHYNNPEKKAGLIDSSGIRITYTDKLRKYDAGIIELGLIYSDANSVPPKQLEFPMTSYCVADCTRKFPKEGINVFATQLHAHLAGRKLFTSQFRNGLKIGELNRDNHYSPHWQHIQRLRNHIKVLPGDVLATTCVYETMNKTEWTWGGYGIEDEMCVNYIHYYPASEVEVCKSAVDNSTLHSFFKKLGVTNKKLKIHEKYLAINWTPAKLSMLRELYHVGPLNVACLDPSGELFKNHPTGWQKVKRPETLSGIYTRTRSVDECFAINH